MTTACFTRRSKRTTWDEESGRWIVETDRGDKMRARFVILANGILTTPKLARIPGMEKFKGESFHTSRWYYNIDLSGKRVGIIGTGATAVQAIPELAKVVGQLYVFQRTPSSIDVRDQRETTEEERETWSRGARLGAGEAGALRQDLGSTRRGPRQRRLPRGQDSGFQGAQKTTTVS